MSELLQQRRRRARRGPPWGQRVVNATFWASASAWLLERFGWLPDLPSGIAMFWLLTFGKDFISIPFQRRARPLLGPGTRSTPLAELMHMPGESHVHVRGRIRALERMPTYLGTITDAVYSRVELVGTTPRFAAHRDFRAHHTETRDFLLVDDSGATVEIRMDHAEVKLPRRTLYLRDERVAMNLLAQLAQLGLQAPRPSHLYRPTITEHWLADGDEIEVLGTVERVADQRHEALPRELPTRPVLVSTRGRPLTVQLLHAP